MHLAARLVLTILTLFAPGATAEQLTLAAAADMNSALRDLADSFEQKTGTRISVSYGASGNLYAQIQNGAPYDIFFSADPEYPRKLASAGLLDPSSLRTYAVGHLVLWMPASLHMNVRSATRERIASLLLLPEVKRIAIANPEHAPYGRAATAALEHLGVKEKVAGKLVLGENVSQAAQFAQSGSAQAAFIPLSLAMSPAMKQAGTYWELPADTYPEIRQVVGIVSASKHQQTARAFLDFVRSDEGAALLKQYGFGVPSAQ